MIETAPEPEPQRGMSFLEHLDELRSRLFRVAVVYAILLAGCWWVSDEILAFLMAPIREHLFAGGDIVFLTLTEPFMVYMKASAVGALFLASPYILWQLWRFVAPGLYRNERRGAALFILFGTVLFIAGGAFGYYIAMPACARWLLALGAQFKAQLTLQSAFQFESRMILGAGAVFEMPAIIVLLAKFGIVTPALLLRHFRLAVLVIAIVAAVVTPSGDALTMTIFAAPMVGLYLLGTGVAWLVAPKAQA